jgi:hypothetical protein
MCPFLDRSLNRNWNRLKKVLQWCRREEPQLKIGLFAKERKEKEDGNSGTDA